ARMLELPYKGDEMAMWVVLPDAVDGLHAVEKSLDALKLAQVATELAPQQLHVALPKFKLEPPGSLQLAATLQELGVKTAFSETAAAFSAIGTPAEPAMRLYISEVVHKAFVKVDELGTEAAAATAIVMAPGGGPPAKPEEFVVDRPFLFFIVDKA